MSRSAEFQQILDRYKKKGKVTSEFRDSLDNERVYKELRQPVNETSFHQIQGGAADITGLSKEDRESASKELSSNNFFNYLNKTTGQLHGDVGPNASKEVRKEAFHKMYKEQTEAKGKMLFGLPKEEEKDMNTGVDLRKRAEEEEEKEGSVSKALDTSIQIAKQSPLAENMPTHMKNDVALSAQNPDKVMASATQSQSDKSENKQPSMSDSFFEAVTFFLPTIIGGAVGGMIGGNEGVSQGAQLGMKAGDLYQTSKERQRDFELKQREGNNLAKERIDIQKSNLEIRKQELNESRSRTKNLEEDREIRRKEHDIDRTIKTKESFVKRGDVSKIKERMANLSQIDDMINEAPELAAGVIPFKIAKGIAGEVGNLTEAERNDAQISPSFYRKLLRSGTTFLSGRLPEEDTKELQKIVNILKKKENGRLGGMIEDFSKSRSKSLGEENANSLSQDLKTEFGLGEKPVSKGDFSRDEIEDMKRKLRSQRGGK